MANIIDDQLPGGPQWIENLDHEPVWVEDKSQLKREMDARNLQMKVATEHTPSAKPDDPRFFKRGLAELLRTSMPWSFKTASGLLGTQETKYLSRERMAVLAQAWDVLCHPISGMGYQIICPKCSRLFGEGHDGVKAENSPASGTLKIECGCTVHVYKAR